MQKKQIGVTGEIREVEDAENHPNYPQSPNVSSPKAGYRYLVTFQLATVIYDLTVQFCAKYLSGRDLTRLREQIIHAARSGRQNIAEGYMEVGLKAYIKLSGVAKASQEELLLDFEDYLRQRDLSLWDKNHPKIIEFRAFRVREVREIGEVKYNTPILPNESTEAANLLITLINQDIFLLDKQIKSLEQKFIQEGGYTEKLFNKRIAYRTSSKIPKSP